MASEEDLDALKARNLCCHCVGEPYLHADIRSKGRRLKCDYCGRKAKAIKLEEMSERIEQAFESHYVRTSNHPDSWQQTLLSDRESDYDWERDGDPVVEAIASAAEITGGSGRGHPGHSRRQAWRL